METEAQITQLCNDPVFGPSARGNGDFAVWSAQMFLVVVSEFSRKYPAIKGGNDLQLPKLDRSDGESFLENTRRRAYAYSLALFGPMDTEMQKDWQALYAITFDKSIREYWGGLRIRIGQKRKRVDPQKTIEAALQMGLPLREAFDLAGVSVATGYRILKRKSGRSAT